MNKSNDVTGDRITNAFKGDKEKYREGWEAIFGGKDMKGHVQQITGDTPHDVILDESKFEEILNEITRLNQDMGLYEND